MTTELLTAQIILNYNLKVDTMIFFICLKQNKHFNLKMCKYLN